MGYFMPLKEVELIKLVELFKLVPQVELTEHSLLGTFWPSFQLIIQPLASQWLVVAISSFA
jgi:hypothetical protein